MKVVVGLGNPGKEYAETRHNVGFMVIDVLARGGRFQNRFQGQLAELTEDAGKLLLVKPDTFMNLSGRCVRQVTDFYKAPLTDLLIVCDDMSLPLGKLRFRAKGTHGGHNGLRNIQEILGTTDYNRLRIGVDAPREANAVGHVLGRFKPGERPVVEEAVAAAVQGVLVWAVQGIDVCMNQFNG
jgi:PTH1 family peptidyl-tRNA hydrolase